MNMLGSLFDDSLNEFQNNKMKNNRTNNRGKRQKYNKKLNNLYREFKFAFPANLPKRDIINKLEIHKVTKENIGEFLDKLHDDELEEDLYEKDQKEEEKQQQQQQIENTYLEIFWQFWKDIKAISKQEKMNICYQNCINNMKKVFNENSDQLMHELIETSVRKNMYQFFYLFLLCLQENNLNLAEKILIETGKFVVDDQKNLYKYDINEYHIYKLCHESTKQTALHYALYYGYPTITEKLITLGCETEVYDSNRLHPWGVANKSFLTLLSPSKKMNTNKSKKKKGNNNSNNSNDKKHFHSTNKKQHDSKSNIDHLNSITNNGDGDDDDNNNNSNNTMKKKNAKNNSYYYGNGKPRSVETIVIGIVKSASMLVSLKNDYKLLTTIFYEMKKQRKNKSNKRVNLINAVIRYFGMNVLISKMKEWPKDTSWIWKERMLQLILRAEVDKNREAKRLKQTRQQKNQKNNVYSSISKDSVLKKHDEEMLTKETFDFLIDYLVQKDANHRIVCGFSDLITIRGKQLLNQQNVEFFKEITNVIKCLCEMLLLNMTHSVDSDSEMDSDDSVDLPDSKEECLLNSFFRMLVMFLLPYVKMKAYTTKDRILLRNFLTVELEETFNFTFSVLKLIFEEVASLRRMAVILKLYVAWSVIKEDVLTFLTEAEGKQTTEAITLKSSNAINNEKTGEVGCSTYTKIVIDHVITKLEQRDSLWLENAMSNNNNMTSINAAKKKEEEEIM